MNGTPAEAEDRDGLLLALGAALEADSTVAACLGAARLAASSLGADAAAFFLVRGARVVDERSIEPGAGAPAGLDASLRGAALAAAAQASPAGRQPQTGGGAVVGAAADDAGGVIAGGLVEAGTEGTSGAVVGGLVEAGAAGVGGPDAGGPGGVVAASAGDAGGTSPPALVAHAFAAHDGLTAVLALAWASTRHGPPPDAGPRLAGIARILAARLRADHAGVSARAQIEQYERWFKTLDQQLRLLDRERQKFSALVGASDIHVLVADVTRTIRWTNKALTGLVGAPAGGGWTGLGCRELCRRLGENGNGEDCRSCPLKRALEHNEVAHCELRQSDAGAIRNFYLTALPIRGPDGGPNEVMVMIQDLSGLEVLRRSESRYRLLFERGANAMVMVDPTTLRLVLANAASTRLLGYDQVELTRLTLADLHAPAEWGRIEARYAAALAEPRPDAFECRLRGSRKTERQVVVFPTRFALEGEHLVMLELLDVTDRKRAEEALRNSEEQLRQSQKMEAVGRLAGGVAHDFNNLLSVIMGRSELMRDRLPPGDPLRASAEQIHAATVRGAWLTRQLLVFGRREMSAPAVLDLHEVVAEMDGMLRPLIGEDIDLVTVARTSGCVKADRGEIEQILMNLAVNARDAMPKGGVLRIEVGDADLDDAAVGGRSRPCVTLAVNDNGCGMDEETLAHVFEPFFTTKEQHKGSGLGLSIVYGIVTRAGGEVRVESGVGQGTTVRIYFPRVEAAPDRVSSPPREEVPPGHETILLVEDDDGVRAVAREALEIDGYTVLEARRAAEALEMARHHAGAIDLVISDVVMPEMGGGELVQRLAPLRPEARVLFISGYNDDAIVRRGILDAGAPFLQKPFTLDALAATVRRLLDRPTQPAAAPDRARPGA